MRKIHINTSREYDVIISNNILNRTGELAKTVFKPCKIAIISDDKVYPIYGETVKKSLEDAGFETAVYIFKNGEKSKNMLEYTNMLEFLAENHFTRSDAVAALGGGVTGDMAGFAAASYLRGISFIQIPTTFLAAVDSSVGGKTGVNLKSGKNLAGAFHQPSLVICDTECLKTLPEETFADGVSEAVKCGMLENFEMLEKMQSEYDVEEIIAQCVEIKRSVVCEDEHDTGMRQLLNFGHTIGHTIEKNSGYTITHGHAVSMGTAAITLAAERDGIAEKGTYEYLCSVLKKCRLPIDCPFSAEDIYSVALSDKKRNGNSITLVLPEKVGKCILYKTDTDKLLDFIKKGLEK